MGKRSYLTGMSAAVLAMLLSIGVCAGAKRDESTDWRDDLVEKAASIRATDEELRWLEIPWAASAEEAIKIAKAEQRPLLVFSVDGDPMDRC